MKRKCYQFKKSLVAFCFLLVLSGTSLFAQTMQITGTVSDEQQEPLMGVSVIIENTSTGTTTNLDGQYSLQAKSGEYLLFSYLGMSPVRIQVGNQPTIDVVMKEDVTMLTETVVIGYGTAKKRDLTGSIASINAAEIANRPSTNPLASLQGKVAGMQIVNTGRAGQDPEIRIRGVNSINGYAPLYVVDGLFMDNINHIDPADIDKMEVLKDASSLAIFGVRGANGAIIITTKKAASGQTRVSWNSSVGFKSIVKKMELTNAAQFKELYNEQQKNQKIEAGAFFDYTPWQADTDWQDEIFQTGFMTNNKISIMGATDKNTFALGVGYITEEGNIKSEEYSKLTLSMSSDYQVSKAIRFGFQFNGSRTLPPDAKGVEAAIKAAPIAPVRHEGSDLLYIMPSFQKTQVWNPMINIETKAAHAKAQNYRGSGHVYGEVDFLKHFHFKATFAMDISANQSRSFSPINWVYNPILETEDKAEKLEDRESLSQTKSNSVFTQSDYILSYTNTFGKHSLSGTLGITTNYLEYSSLTGGRSQKYEDIIFSIPNNNPDKWWISILDQAPMTNGGNQYRRFTMSYLARFIYSYQSKYLLNASYRRDGSSMFKGVDNVWENFYSVGAGWVVSEEAFMEDIPTLDYLKLKGSWGKLGNQATGGRDYPTYPNMTSTGGAVFGDRIIPGYDQQYIVQQLGWEKTRSWEIGFETVLLNNRLRFEPVYYNKTTDDLIVLLDGRHGVKNSLENLGSIQNKGWEFTASWMDKIGDSGWKYNIGANLTTIDNEVLTLGRDNDDAIFQGTGQVSRTMPGYSIGHFYGYKVAGVYQNAEDIKTSYPNKLTAVKPGDLKFEDVNGDGVIDDKDRTIIGSPIPDLTYGFNLGVSFKNIDLSIDMMGVYGNEIYRTWDNPTYGRLNYLVHSMNRWHGEGTSNWEPIIDPGRSINLMNSNYFIEDGSFFRLRNIQLGYTFESEVLKKAYINSLRLYANVQNLKTWSKNTGFVPEIGGSATSAGIDGGTYPMPAIYTVGFNLTF